jgi:hypothetical protein
LAPRGIPEILPPHAHCELVCMGIGHPDPVHAFRSVAEAGALWEGEGNEKKNERKGYRVEHDFSSVRYGIESR